MSPCSEMKVNMPDEKIAILSDVPPIRDGGTANHSVAWSLSSALRPVTSIIMTRRMHREVGDDRICKGLDVPVWIFKDASKLGLRRYSEDLRALIDCFLWLLQLPRAAGKLRRSNCTRILSISSNHWVCIAQAWMLKLASGLPADIFLMDDLEASARMQGKKFGAWSARRVEGALLKRLDTVWTISVGYGEHLEKKYGVETEYLPLPIRRESIDYRAYDASAGKKVIGYSGGIHGLYQSVLRELVAYIAQHNRSAAVPYVLRIFVARKPADIEAVLLDTTHVEVVEGLDNKGLVEGLAGSYANLLPYSFDPAFRLMVSTAFSCKTSEYLACGRPLLVYGPEYATVPRHFMQAGLPLVETREGEIGQLLSEIGVHDGPRLIGSYNQLLCDFHSPNSILKRLTSNWGKERPV